MKITIIHNGFHGETSATINVNGAVGEKVELTASQLKKLATAACGSKSCKCGETMLKALTDYGVAYAPRFLTIPADGDKIEINGNYPQR